MSGTAINNVIFTSTLLDQHQTCCTWQQQKLNNLEKLTVVVEPMADKAVFDKNKKCNVHTNHFNSEHNSQCSRATTRQQDSFIVLTSLRDITATTDTASKVNISNQTIHSLLPGADLHSRWLAVRPCLTLASQAACLAWAQRHLAWTRQQWSRVLFTDELWFSYGRIQVWRHAAEGFPHATVREHDGYGVG